MRNCKSCGKITKNPIFCSRSCSAKTTNLVPKRKRKLYFCTVCGIEVKHRRKVCPAHNKCIVDWSNMTLGETNAKRKYQRNSRVRNLARRAYKKSDKPKECIICGYKTHYEVCHVKPISDYPDEAKVTEINHLDNLISLCPTHHWELDNGHLQLGILGIGPR